MAIPFNPHGYQLRGMQLMTQERGSGLLLDPGMGKTITALMAFEVLRDAGMVSTMLVVAPIKPMYDTWPREIKRWEQTKHLRIVTLHGKDKFKNLTQPADIYIINPEGIQWYVENITRVTRGVRNLPDVLCVDESTKFKNSGAKRFKALRKIIDYFSYRWILTGTFVPNGLEDVFGQVFVMDQGAHLGKYITHFRNKYFTADSWGHSYTPIQGAFEEVCGLIDHMVLKLDAEDYLTMPEFNSITRPVRLPPKALQQYKQVEKEFIALMREGTVVAANKAAAGTKCRQIANGNCYVEEESDDGKRQWATFHTAKVDALEELLEETNGKSMLIIYEFKHDLAAITGLLGKMGLGKNHASITGVTGNKFNKLVEAFNNGELQFMLAHAGSLHGLNIQDHCRHMTWYGIPWNLENYIQAIWRLYRQGKNTDPVFCYHITAEDTIDEKVVQVLADKNAVQDDIENLLKG